MREFWPLAASTWLLVSCAAPGSREPAPVAQPPETPAVRGAEPEWNGLVEFAEWTEPPGAKSAAASGGKLASAGSSGTPAVSGAQAVATPSGGAQSPPTGQRSAARAPTKIVSVPPGVNSGGGSGNGKPAIERPDPSGDDIVAQRLRRAAEEEQDPELRRKLWQEYVNYKKNAQTP